MFGMWFFTLYALLNSAVFYAEMLLNGLYHAKKRQALWKKSVSYTHLLTTERSGDGLIHITLSVASECIQKRVVKYDKSGDNHYDLSLIHI